MSTPCFSAQGDIGKYTLAEIRRLNAIQEKVRKEERRERYYIKEKEIERREEEIEKEFDDTMREIELHQRLRDEY